MIEYQLRIYRLHPDTFPAFLEAWRDVAVPIRRKLGFDVVGAWYTEASNEFVWMLAYEGADGFAAADARYYDSPDRRGVLPSRDPAQFIAAREFRVLGGVPVPPA